MRLACAHSVIIAALVLLWGCEFGDASPITSPTDDVGTEELATGDDLVATADSAGHDPGSNSPKLKLLSISPNTGTVDGGATVVIEGVGFVNGTRVYFGDAEAANLTVKSLYLLTCTSPPAQPGVVDVRVSLPDGQADTLEGAFTYTKKAKEPLAVTSILPESGPAAGGFLCQLNGIGFEAGVTVRLGSAVAQSVTIFSDTALSFIAPPGNPGLADVTVKRGDESAVLADGFEYVAGEVTTPLTLSGVVPTSGPVEGGNLALLTGSGFADGISIQFGAQAASVVEIASGTSLTVEVPAGQAGTVDIVASLGEETAILYGGFEYLLTEESVPLTAVSIQPTNGPESGGTLCVVTGTGFGAGVQVKLADTEALYVNVLSTEVLTFVTPPGGAGATDVVLSLGDQEVVLEEAFTYVGTAKLSILSVEPSSGPAAGGTVCLVKGGGFAVDTSVFFGGQMAEIIDVPSSGSLIAATPSFALEGAVDVTVTDPSGGSATLEGGFDYFVDEVLSLALVEPDSGDVDGGFLVMLTGAGFAPGMSVLFGETAAGNVAVLSSNAAVVTVPPGDEGFCSISLLNPDGEEVVKEAVFIYTVETVTGNAPSIGSVTPKKGPVEGSTWVAISGENFATAAGVVFGSNPAAAVVRVSVQKLLALTPAGAPGKVDVEVANPDGKSSTLANGFQFVVVSEDPVKLESVSPAGGPVTGGTTTLLVGANFKPGAYVYVGYLPVISVTWLSNTQMVVVTPAGEVGPTDIVVVNPDGTTAVLEDGFAYFDPQSLGTPPPLLAGVFPPYGHAEGGDEVTLSGAHFQQGVQVYFDGHPVEVLELQGDSLITVSPPAHTAGSVDVAVVNPDGQSSVLQGGYVYFVNPPFIAIVAPGSGPTTGGNMVSILGSGFKAGLKVFWGGQLIGALIVKEPDQVEFVAPPHEEGLIDVTVVNADGLSDTLGSGYLYKVPEESAPPVVNAVSPAHGNAGGGYLAIITGTCFADGMQVWFGAKPASQVKFLSDQAVSALAPSGAADSTVDVKVVNPDGKEGFLADGFHYDDLEVEALGILSVTPSSGPEAGGTSIAVVGMGFIQGLTEVSVGGFQADSVSVISSNVLTAVTPPGTPGAVDVTVQNGDESKSLAAGFLYIKAQAPGIPPGIIALTPSAGPVAGGTVVQVSGNFLQAGAVVLFGGIQAPLVQFQSEQMLVVETPAHEPGTVSVVVMNPDNLSAIYPGGFTFYEKTTAKPPVVAGLVPAFGSALGGDSITVAGANFAAGLSCYICGSPAGDPAVLSGTQFTATTPAGPVGGCDVEVVNPDGQNGVLGAGYNYQAPQPTLQNVVPGQGPVEGGIEVVIYGENFMAGMEVWFGVTKSQAVSVFSDQTASAAVPPGLPGKVHVKVVNPGGLFALLENAFEYSQNPEIVPPPEIVGLVPGAGPVTGGTVLSLQGAWFQDGAQVMFGGIQAEVSFVDGANLLVVTPPGQPGPTDVTVLNPDGQGATGKSAFSYVVPTAPPPKLFGVVPSSGPESGGGTILVTGSNLTADGMLYLGMKPVAQYTFLNISVVSGVTPVGTPGPVTVSYVAADGQDATLQNGYTYVPAPGIDSVSPGTGPVEGGTEVTIVGQNFQPQAQVLFGSEPAASALVENSLIIHAVAPPGLPGEVDVTVVNMDGQGGVAQGAFTYLLAPELLDIAPLSGPATGGTPISIWGTNLAAGLTVTIGGEEAGSVKVVNDGLVLCTTPAGDEGPADVEVVNPDGQSVVLEEAFLYLPAGGEEPLPETIFPNSGPEGGGTLVTLDGLSLGEPDVILLGDTPIVEFLSVADEAVVFETPPGEPGAVDVTFVTTEGKSALLPEAFTYIPLEELLPAPTLGLVDPISGPTAGNVQVTLSGADFQENAEVFFGAAKALEVVYVGVAGLTATTPAHSAGIVNVTVLNPDGQLSILSDGYAFVPPPVLDDVVPQSGSSQGGSLVTITGSGFLTGNVPSKRSSVHICSDFPAQEGCEKVLDSKLAELTETSIVYEAPLHSPGFVDVVVANPDGQKGYLGASYYYNEPPVLGEITPDSGPAAGGTEVTIAGRGFKAGMKVYFGEIGSPEVAVLSATELTTLSPPGPGGLVDIFVENPDGSVDAMAEAFLYIEAPRIDQVYPTSGPEAGGTQVTVEGEFFSTGEPGPVVFFGAVEVPQEDTNVVSSTIIIVSTPPGVGPAAVQVVNPDGQDDTLGQAFVYVPPAPPPVINFVIPSYGSGNGGYIVSVVGSGFMEGAQVYFGKPDGWTIATNPLVKNQGTLISVVAPPHDPGLVDVRVVNTNQQEVSAQNVFTYTEPLQLPPLEFVSVSPNRAPLDGDTEITISGKGFLAGIQVYFGEEPNWAAGTSVQYLGPTIIHVTVPEAPSGEAGLVDIRLTNPSAPEEPDEVVADDAFGYTSGGVFVLSGLRMPVDDRNDHFADVADFNNDGIQDLAVFKYSNKGGDVFVNTQAGDFGLDGWFEHSADLTYAGSFAAHGDFDGDGDIDLVLRRSNNMVLHRNNGDGSFAPYEDKGGINGEARALTVADFNCDGHLDVFVAMDSISSSRANRILVNDGDGNFTHHTTDVLPAHYEYTEMAAAADIDLDGDVDLVLANGSAMQNRLYYNNCNNKDYPPDCANDVCTVEEFAGHFYAFCSDSRTWAAAQEFCTENGYHLAVVNDVAEQNFLLSNITQYRWIGYSDQVEEGSFEWEGDDSNYTQWCDGQPDDSSNNEDCAVIRWSSNGCWGDRSCTTTRPFICEAAVPKTCDPWEFTDAQYGPNDNFPLSGFDSFWVSLVDIDANLYPDVILANWGQQTRVYLNFGGNFEGDDLAHWPQDEENPFIDRLYPTDIDLDGDIDVVAQVQSGTDDRWLRVYSNDLNDGGSGTFTLLDGAVPEKMTDTRSIAVGDLDGDMLPDIYVVNKEQQDQMLMNNGFADALDWSDGNRVGVGNFVFNTVHGYPEIIEHFGNIEAGDFDGDGDLDLLLAHWDGAPLSIYANDGLGRFEDVSADTLPVLPYPVHAGLNSMAIHDMDADGDLDIVVAGRGDCSGDTGLVARVQILLNDGDGVFTDHTDGNIAYGSSDWFDHVAIDDVNQDGKADIVANGYHYCSYYNKGYKRRVFINGGDPFDTGDVYFFDLTANWWTAAFSHPSAGVLTDLNGDGWPDFYLGQGGSSYQNTLFYSNGSQFVDMTTSHLPSVSDTTYKVNSDDFDADGDLDILVTNWGVDRLHLQEVDTKFADATASNLPQDSRQSYDACVADYDADGLPDVFTVNWDQKNQLYLNQGEANLADRSDNLPWDDDYGRGCVAGDFNGDGDIDVFVIGNGMARHYINTNQ